jgi:hypothetical protein
MIKGEKVYMLEKKPGGLVSISFALALCLTTYTYSQKPKDKKVMPSGTPIIWQEPADVASRDLYHGAGGEAMKPDLSKITFIKEETGGYSTKYRVRDGAGRIWVAKLSKEAQSEAASNRLMWAIGYPTELSYLVPRVEIEGKGTFENVRFEARPENIQRMDEWKWDKNPFNGKPEFQGLKVMMILLNNWDIKDENTKILVVRNEATGENQIQYIISDLGGTLGKTGNFISRSRNKPEDFTKSKFIKGVKGGYVDFNYGGKRQDLFKDITVEQARWVGDLLSRLSDQQLIDAFRAGNYTDEEAQALAMAIRERINELTSLQTSGVNK